MLTKRRWLLNSMLPMIILRYLCYFIILVLAFQFQLVYSVMSYCHFLFSVCYNYLICHCKDKVLPYLLSSVWPRADPGVHSVSSQVTFKSFPGSRLSLLSIRHVVTIPASPSFHLYQVILLGDRGT